LMLATFATLILLVQHISTMLQAPNIAAAAGAELREVISADISGVTGSNDGKGGIDGEGEFDGRGGFDGEAGLDGEGSETRPYPVRARRTGYVQYVDADILRTLAEEKNLVIRLLHKPGRHVRSGAVLALVVAGQPGAPAGRVDEQAGNLMRRAFQIGNGRTPTQDLEYAVNQLAEMAVRAMSPAINDPFTAMTCLDHMGDGLVMFLQRGERGSHYYDRSGKLRLVLEPVTFGELLGAAFDMLRHASCDNASVLLHMLAVIDAISQEAQAPEARRLLLRHVSLIQAESEAGDLIEQDRQAIQLSGQALQAKLEGAT